MFRLVLGPDLLHRRDLLAHLLRTGLVNRAVVFRLFGIPKKTGSHATRRWREMDFRTSGSGASGEADAFLPVKDRPR